MTRSYSTLLSWLSLTIVASLMLYHTSDRVNALDRQLRSLNQQIADEQKSLHILKAEWVYLANPRRVEDVAKRHLAVGPTTPARVVAMRNIDTLLPMRDEADTVMASNEVHKDNMIVAALDPDTVSDNHISIKAGHSVGIASATHINEHMMMPHTARVEAASTDRIGALIGSLGLNP